MFPTTRHLRLGTQIIQLYQAKIPARLAHLVVSGSTRTRCRVAFICAVLLLASMGFPPLGLIMSKERLLVLDGHSLAFRALCPAENFITTSGVYTNAVHGFLDAHRHD